MSDYPTVDLSTDALLTTTRSVRKRLDLTIEVIDGDGTLTGENANQYWSSVMPATWSYMLAARSRGLGTTWTGVTIMADDEMRAILGLPDNVYHATTIPPPTTAARPSAPPDGFRSMTCCISTGGERAHRSRPAGRSPVRERTLKEDNDARRLRRPSPPQ